MIPMHDEPHGGRVFPLVNLALIVANIAVFVYQVSLPGPELLRFIERYAIVPADLTRNFTNPNELLTVFTAMFMHGGLLHIAGNMLYLWIFGDNVEDAMGSFGYLVFYLVTGIAATVAQVLVTPTSTVPNVGASGAIAGVLGAYLVLFPGARVKTVIMIGVIPFFTTLTALVVIGFWAVGQFLAGFASFGMPMEGGGIAYFAHIGGFVAGLVLARPFARNLGRARTHIPRYGYRRY